MSDLKTLLAPRFILGLAIILLAISLLLEGIGLNIIGKALGNWPLGMAVLGIALLLSPGENTKRNNTRNNKNLAYILLGFGLGFFLAQHGFLGLTLSRLIIPAILLLVGIKILQPHLFAKNTNDDARKGSSIDVFSVLGGGEFNTRSQNLSGGNIVCILGGAEVDIREADTEKDVIEIDIFSVLGGAEIRIPAHWQVSVKVIPFLGGVSNKTTCLADKLRLPKKQVNISGLAFMGGVDIKN